MSDIFTTLPTFSAVLDTGHEDATNLIHAWLFNAGTGLDVKDYVDGNNGALRSGGYGAWASGGGYSFNESGAYMFSAVMADIAPPYTVVAGVELDSTSGYQGIVGWGASIIYGVYDGNMYKYGSETVDKWYKAGSEYTSAQAVTTGIHIFGYHVHGGSTIVTSGSYPLRLGNDDWDSYFKGRIAFVYIYTGETDATLQARIAASPYDMFFESGHGFLSVTPAAVYGGTDLGQAANYATAQKFTMPSSGTLELSEIGTYAQAVSAPSSAKIAVFTHDASNDCPEALVTDSEATLTLGASTVKQAYTYSGSKPQVTGGTVYWLAILSDEGFLIHGNAAAGELERTATYPTWPTGTEWETHNHYSYDMSLYAVYGAPAQATYQFGRPLSVTTAGSWTASSGTIPECLDETVATDTDYAASGSPVDELKLRLSPLNTPDSDTAILRVRLKKV